MQRRTICPGGPALSSSDQWSDVRLDAEQRLAIDLQIDLPLGYSMVTCDMNVAPVPLQATGIREARSSVSRHQQVHRFAAILRYQCSVRTNSGTGDETRMGSTCGGLIEIV